MAQDEPAMSTSLNLLDGADTLMDTRPPMPGGPGPHSNWCTYRKRLPIAGTQAATMAAPKLYLRTERIQRRQPRRDLLDIHRKAPPSAPPNCRHRREHGPGTVCPLHPLRPGGRSPAATPSLSTSLIDFVFRELAISYLGRYDPAAWNQSSHECHRPAPTARPRPRQLAQPAHGHACPEASRHRCRQ
jgi:hypothetical protein